MTFTQTTQYAFQSFITVLLSIAAANIVSVIPDNLNFLRGGFVGLSILFFVTSLFIMIATLFASDKEIDAARKNRK